MFDGLVELSVFLRFDSFIYVKQGGEFNARPQQQLCYKHYLG